MANKTVMGKSYLDLAGAAEQLTLTPQTIRAYIKAGKLPALKIGGKWLIEPSHLAELVASGQARTAY